MARRSAREARPAYPGYTGSVETLDDFLKCHPDRQRAIMRALQQLVALTSRNLARAEERIERASKAVERERQAIAEERDFLSHVAAAHVEFSKAMLATESTEVSRLLEATSAIATQSGSTP